MSVIALYYSTLSTTVVPALVVSINNTVVSVSRYGAGAISSSPASAVTASGGRTPYTYLWTRVSGDSFSITTPTAATTTFSTFLSDGEYRQGVYQCAVTDFLGTVTTVSVTIILYSQPSDTGTTNPTPTITPEPTDTSGGGGTAPSVRDDIFIQQF